MKSLLCICLITVAAFSPASSVTAWSHLESEGLLRTTSWRNDALIVSSRAGQFAISFSTRENDPWAWVEDHTLPILADQFDAQKLLEAEATIGLTDQATIQLGYRARTLGQSNLIGSSNTVFGAGLQWRIGDQFKLGARVAQSDFSAESRAFALDVNYNSAAWGLQSGVRRIERNFEATGDWHRIGTENSPQDIQDFRVGAWLNFTDRLRVSGEATLGESLSERVFDYSSWSTKLEYSFAKDMVGIIGYESVVVDFFGGPDVRQRWASLGVGLNMGSGNVLRFMLQYGDLRNGQAWGGSSAGPSKSHVISSQLSVKF